MMNIFSIEAARAGISLNGLVAQKLSLLVIKSPEKHVFRGN